MPPKTKSRLSQKALQNNLEEDDSDYEITPSSLKNQTSKSKKTSLQATVAATLSQTTSSTQADRLMATMDSDRQLQLVNDVVVYLLATDQKKLPIRRQTITKNVLKENSKVFVPVMVQAKEKLSSVFGIELVEIAGAQKSSYILVNRLDNKFDDQHQLWPTDDNQRIGLVMIILSLIFMRGNMLEEEELFHMLTFFGIGTEHPHEVFGDVRRVVATDLVRLAYLERTGIAGADPPKFVYRWGQRAVAETRKKDVLDFVCQIYIDKQPQDWPSQWRDIQQNEASDGDNVAVED